MNKQIKNVIPPMKNPLGRYWEQPHTDKILIDDIHALMELSTFNKLLEYSTTMPSGVYYGKMWKSHTFRVRNGKRVFTNQYLLRWYDYSEKVGHCSNEHRIILLVD